MSEIQPVLAVAAHHVVDFDRLTAGFDDPTAHHHSGRGRLLPGDLERLSGIAVEAVGIDRRNVAREAFGDLLALALAQTGPRGPDREPRHRGDVEAAANDRVELREAPALAKYPAVLHRAEQRVV